VILDVVIQLQTHLQALLAKALQIEGPYFEGIPNRRRVNSNDGQ